MTHEEHSGRCRAAGLPPAPAAAPRVAPGGLPTARHRRPAGPPPGRRRWTPTRAGERRTPPSTRRSTRRRSSAAEPEAPRRTRRRRAASSTASRRLGRTTIAPREPSPGAPRRSASSMPRIVDDAPADEDYWTSPPEPRLHDQRGAAHHGRQHQRKPRLLGVTLPPGALPRSTPAPNSTTAPRSARPRRPSRRRRRRRGTRATTRRSSRATPPPDHPGLLPRPSGRRDRHGEPAPEPPPPGRPPPPPPAPAPRPGVAPVNQTPTPSRPAPARPSSRCLPVPPESPRPVRKGNLSPREPVNYTPSRGTPCRKRLPEAPPEAERRRSRRPPRRRRTRTRRVPAAPGRLGKAETTGRPCGASPGRARRRR